MLPTGRSIALQTREGKDIRNFQAFAVSQVNKNMATLLEKKYGFATFRAPPSSCYNCHGLVFASRRTCIEDVEQIPEILQHDGFEEVDVKQVIPGDVALYYQPSGDIEHSGIVVEKPDVLDIPVIWSKWGCSHEVVHKANYGPYAADHIRYFRVIK